MAVIGEPARPGDAQIPSNRRRGRRRHYEAVIQAEIRRLAQTLGRRDKETPQVRLASEAR